MKRKKNLFDRFKRLKTWLLLGVLVFVTPLKAQNYTQPISLNLQKVSLKVFFKEVEAKTRFTVVYRDVLIDGKKDISINAVDKPLNEIVKTVLNPKGLEAKYVNKTIVITKKKADNTRQKYIMVSGLITDEKNVPIIGATIKIKGGTTGTVTDIDGKFKLNAPRDGQLLISYIGYKSREIPVAGKTYIRVSLAEDIENLNEIVVVGYGTMNKRDLTGTVQTIKSKNITLAPTSNPAEALQGKVAGLNIVKSSGQAGSDVSITLRGDRSLNGNNAPLFIIDGVPGNYSDLNPNDIESIEVLKDASSAAIYGSAGSNGIIMITTKKAKSGKVKINFNMYEGYNGFLRYPSACMKDGYINLRREAYRTTNGAYPTDDAVLFSSAEWEAVKNNQWVDWLDEGTQNGKTQNYSLSFSGGNEKTTAYFSANYNKIEGVVKNDNSSKYSFKTTIDHKFNKYLKSGANVLGSYKITNGLRGQYFTRIYAISPLGTAYNEDGSINIFPVAGSTSDLSPLADMQGEQYKNNTKTLGLNPTAYIEIKPIKGLSVKTVISSYLSFYRTGLYNGQYSSAGYGNGKSSAEINNGNTVNYRWENIANYDFTLKHDHHFIITGVTSWAHDTKETSGMSGYNIDYPYEFYNMGVSDATSRDISSGYVKTQNMAYIIRANYSYKGRYLLTVSNRYEGSSMLADGHKWANFPAAAVAWRISDESFMENLYWLDNLKLRVSYGVTGNDGVGAYSTQSFSTAGTNLAFQDIAAPYYMYGSTIANRKLTWEKTYGRNIGFDFGVLHNRINLTAEYYYNDTKDVLFKRTLPASQGGSKTSNFSIWQNNCSTNNKGFEFVLNTVNVKTNNFNWSSTITFATNKEKIKSFVSDTPTENASNSTYWYIAGHPINSFYDYKYDGIFQNVTDAEAYDREVGDVKIEEVEKDNVYDKNDKQYLGSATPKWTCGFSNTFEYKGFDLTFLFDVRWGQTMFDKILGWYDPSGMRNGPKIIDYWTPENTSGRFPRPNSNYTSFSSLPTGANSLFYIDGSYIKLRNITFGYTVPSDLLKKIYVSRLRVYATVTDPYIYTKSKYLKSYDPERGGDDEFPLTRQIVLGLNLSF